MPDDLTAEALAELRRLYGVAFAVAAPENDWEEWVSKAAEAFPALLDAAERDLGVRAPDTLADLLMRRVRDIEAERDALAAKVERVRVVADTFAASVRTDRLRAILDGTSAHCDRGPCHLPRGHGGPCSPGGDALDATETDHA